VDPRVTDATWDPAQYLRYADARTRPFVDLLARVEASAPARVIDAGCGAGNLTRLLAERWPDADILGFDSSPDMLDRARTHATPRLRFEVADATTWQPEAPVDVLASNALLHWIEGHDQLAVRWLDFVTPGGTLAFQVPGNFDSPSHRSITELLGEPRWQAVLPPGAAIRAGSFSPEHYAALLLAAGAEVDAWETTYVHVLGGDDPVLEWIKGTALRPVLDVLDVSGDDVRAAFLDELASRLRDAYPPTPRGTLFPFRRIFVVARRS
jgi:trans-aconitate 2-methyltransferase